ncbi:hypothetical protein QCD85_04480 [Paenibacillus sp. PsM32]|uniref:hypothetical protein n=1 Tax=Paenibacillus sp. PsM32 TaxID=3030536 RepID=UPI00263BD143|nr:hypothetical protein [Paenibacillus sp. PsM32]MDN4617338.1 hypothetical protein [Paenibacillus sp. PsM32]
MGLLTLKKTGAVLLGALLMGTVYQGGTAHALNYSNDVVPVLSSNAGTNGTASASAEEVGHEAWKAFDDNSSPASSWKAPASSSNQLIYQFNTKKVITQYTVQADTYDTSEAPKKWQLAGKIGKNWLVVDEQINQTHWKSGEQRTYTIANDTAYTAYALFISSNNGGGHVAVSELELYEFGDNTNLVPLSNAMTSTSGGASASANEDTAWKAFDHNTASDSYWQSDDDNFMDASLQYRFESPQVVKGYSITLANKATAPAFWTLVGSNDGQQWEEVLHDVKSSYRWEVGQKKVYEIDNTKAYKTYKLIFDRNSGPSTVAVSEFELF